jgi:hypothetical protein
MSAADVKLDSTINAAGLRIAANIESELVEDRYAVESMRYVAGVAMQKQDRSACVGSIDVPAMKRDSVAGLEADVSIIEACILWRCLERATRQPRKKYHPLLKDIHQDSQQHVTGCDNCDQRRNRPHGS